MDNKNNFSSTKKIKSDPTSNNYSDKINSKAHEKSPFGENEPSNNTTYK
ncbi:hypothetical protein [Clostridium sp. HBUAS56017]|nr:hypothetical protein [Clostridium sp. HBUAS56017]